MDWVNLTAAGGSAAAAVFAGVQIFFARRDANRRATLDFLRQVDERLQSVWCLDTRALQSQILSSYGPSGSAISADATKYLALLNTLDLVALAYHKELVDTEILADHVATLMKQHVLSLTFLSDFRKACNDAKVYEHLGNLLLAIDSPQRRVN